MGNFVISLLSASLLISGIAAAVWVLEEKKVLKKFASGTKALIWFLLILGLLIPMKPSMFGPLVKIPVSGGQLSIDDRGSDNVLTSGSAAGAGLAGNAFVYNMSEDLDDETIVINDGTGQTAFSKKNAAAEGTSGTGFLSAFFGAAFTGAAEFFRKVGAFFTGQGILAVLFGIWCAGFLIAVLKTAYREYCFARAFKRWAEPAEDPEVLEALDEVKTAAGYRFSVRVYLCPFLTSPVLKGLVCPSILIPVDYKEYSDIRLILAHELTHACRQDLWMKAAAEFAALLHWFNPAVKMISKEMSLWCELACDETVLKGTDEETRIRYGMVLLNAAKRANGTGRASFHTCPTSFSTPLFESARQIKKRVYACADGAHKKKGFVLVALSAVFILASGSIFQVDYGKAEALSGSYPYPYASAASENQVVTIDEKENWIVYEDNSGVWKSVPGDYIEIRTKLAEDALTCRDVEDLYDKAGADKRTDKLAVRFSDGGLLLIDPEELIPISPTVAGGAPWYIKAYIHLGDIWDLVPEVNTNQQIHEITGDVLMKLVDQSWSDEQEFRTQAASEIAKEFGIPENRIVLDISRASQGTETAEEK